MSIDEELALIRKNRAPDQPPTPAVQPPPTPPAEPVKPAPKTAAEIDAELGLPPAETGLAPLPDQDAGFFEVMGAAWRGETIRTDAWNHAAVRQMELVSEMFQMLSPASREKWQSTFAGRGAARKFVKGRGWVTSAGSIMALAAEEAAQSPDDAARWARYPLTAGAMEERILSDRIADLDEAEAVLAQDGGGFAEFLGTGLRAMTDETSVMLAPFGLQGSLWRKIAGEATLGALGEAAVLPKEYRVAEEMGLPDPAIAPRLAMGAAFGGTFALGAELLGRGFVSFKARVEARRASLTETIPPGVDRIDHEAELDAAEAELRGDLTVQESLGPAGRPKDGTLGAIVNKGDRARVVLINTAKETDRKLPIDPVLDDRLSLAVGAVYGPGYEVRVYSGGQKTQAELRKDGAALGLTGADLQRFIDDNSEGSVRHDHGKAADVYIFGPDGKQVTGDGLAPIAQYWAASRFGGVGLEMQGGGIHLDIHETPPAGGAMSWTYSQLTPAQQAALDAGLRGEMPDLRGTPGTPSAPGAAPALPPVGPDAPADWARIRNGIFAGESGADWNALFGYQNRKGGKFSHIKPSEMTVDQWLEFQDPNGEYGQWVKANRPDPENGVATPMGAYQIVGDTLAMLKRDLRLKGDEVMTPEFQDYLAQEIYRRQGTGAWQGYKGPRDSYTPGSVDGPAPDFGPTVRGYTGQNQVAVGDDTRIDVDYEVVDYRSLIRASGDLQPRDRTRINSDAWVADTAARLDPAQLMPAPTADRGTPIVGPDNVIESGNGRTMAIARAYERYPDRAEAYRGAIEAAGFTIPDGVDQPVLIARRRTDLTPDQRRQMVIDAQDSGVAQMTPTEVARATSRNLQAPILSRLDPTQPLTADANGDFVRAALATLPRSARNAMFDPGGALNALGQRQLREAIFARAWPDPDILARYTEGAPAELKSLMEALETAAPSWAALKADIEAGLVTPDMDISGFVLDAMRLIAAARELAGRQGMPIAKAVAELIDEVDLIEGAISPLTAALVRKMWQGKRAAPAEEVASFLTRYADEARKAGAAGGMFDTPGPRDVLRTIDPVTFGDLPEDLGTARGFATRPTSEAPPETVADMTGADFDQGAQSPAAEAVHAEIEAELRGPNAEPFGPVYQGFTGNPDGAIAHLLAQKTGEVPDAFAIPGGQLGNASLVYGNDQFGLRHIQLKRPEMLDRLPDLLRNGRVETDPQGQSRLYIVDDADPANVAVIRLDWDGEDRRWLVTAYQDNWGKFARDRKEAYRTGPSGERVPSPTGQRQDTPVAPATQGARQTAVRPDPDTPDLIDTRGQGVRYHGSTQPIGKLTDEYIGSEKNFYGQGFYTTDAVAITDGYSKARKSTTGVIYRVEETGPIQALDMEQPIPDWFRTAVDKDDGSDVAELVAEALAENPANLREFYDAVRELSPNYQLPTYEVQEIFDGFARIVRDNGFNALDHTGGLLTKKAPHAVRIYLSPETTVRLVPVERRTFENAASGPGAETARQGASDAPSATAPAANPAEAISRPSGEALDPIAAELAAARADLGEFADIEIDLPDGTTARAGDILDDIEADRRADAVIQACGITQGGAQ